MIEVYVHVITEVDRVPVEYLNGEPATWDGSTSMPLSKNDLLAGLNPKGTAKVRVCLEEKLNGPTGTYSSTSVRIEIQVNCDQTEPAVDAAGTVLGDKAGRILEQQLVTAHTRLLDHLDARPR